eukprot:1076117-Prymnesium_polylepis.2
MGRRPELKSDEFFGATLLVIEIAVILAARPPRLNIPATPVHSARARARFRPRRLDAAPTAAPTAASRSCAHAPIPRAASHPGLLYAGVTTRKTASCEATAFAVYEPACGGAALSAASAQDCGAERTRDGWIGRRRRGTHRQTSPGPSGSTGRAACTSCT